MAASRFRDILGGWLEPLSSSGAAQIRDEVVGLLRNALDTSEFKAACWTLGEVGFRTDEVVAGLWSVADRVPGEDGDTSLATLVALSEGLRDRERLLDSVHQRARLRYSLFADQGDRGMADPASLDVVQEAWLRDLLVVLAR